jgi:hypothetical protein
VLMHQPAVQPEADAIIGAEQDRHPLVRGRIDTHQGVAGDVFGTVEQSAKIDKAVGIPGDDLPEQALRRGSGLRCRCGHGLAGIRVVLGGATCLQVLRIRAHDPPVGRIPARVVLAQSEVLPDVRGGLVPIPPAGMNLGP